MEKLGATLAPGDVILVNDPYAGGTHLNDVTIIYPVFREGRLIFFPAVRAHWADVGGMVPGSMSGKATEIYQEGIRIPPLKILEGGRMNEAALDLLLANMRVPEERLGDFQPALTGSVEQRRQTAWSFGLESPIRPAAAPRESRPDECRSLRRRVRRGRGRGNGGLRQCPRQ